MINAEDLPPRRTYNAVVDFVDVNVSRGLGDKAAFVDPVRELTYGELQATTWRFARALRTLGLRQEDRIILLLLDAVAFPIAFWGAIRAGVIAIPLNSMLHDGRIYLYVLDNPGVQTGDPHHARELFEVLAPVLIKRGRQSLISS